MKRTLLKGLIVLKMSLMTSCVLNPFAIDSQNAELVRQLDNGRIERISCFDEKTQRIMCFDEKDLNIINKCVRRNQIRD